MNERQLAFKILNKIERDNAYSNLTLDAALREKCGRFGVFCVCHGTCLRRHRA